MLAVNAIHHPTRRLIAPAIKDYHLYLIAILAALAWCNAMMFVIVRVNNLRDQAKADVTQQLPATDLQNPGTPLPAGDAKSDGQVR